MQYTTITTSWLDRTRHRVPVWWLCVLAGGLIGGIAALLLFMMSSPLRAAMAVVALPVGLFAVASPHLALYGLSAIMIGQWPGQILKLGAAGLIGVTVLWALVRRRNMIPQDTVLMVLFPFIVLIWVSAISVRHDPSAIRIASSWTGYVAYYWAVSTLTTDSKVAERMGLVFLFSGFVAAVIGLLQYVFRFTWIITAYTESDPFLYLGTGDFTSLQRWGGHFRIDSITGSDNYMGMAMQLPIAFAVYWTIRQKTIFGRLFGIGIVLSMLVALVLTFTRGAIFVTVLVVAPLLVLKFGWKRSYPYVMGGALVGIIPLIFYEPFRERIMATFSQLISADPFTAGGWRRSVIEVGVGIFLDNFWTGVGLQQHRWAVRAVAPSDFVNPMEDAQMQFHNAYLWISVELGIFGLILILLLLAVVWLRIRALQRYYRATGEQRLEDLAHASEIAWIALMADMALYPVVDAIFRYHWVLLGVIAALTRVAADRDAYWWRVADVREDTRKTGAPEPQT